MLRFFQALAGAVLLAFGRKVFWLFVAGIGFFTAIEFSARFLRSQPAWLGLLIALVIGVLGALLAIFFQNVAIWIVGFLAGGYFLVSMLGLLGLEAGWLALLSFLVGGILGAILTGLLFDWALIVLSSLSGATIVVQALSLTRATAVVVFIVLVLLGILIQSVMMRADKKPAAS